MTTRSSDTALEFVQKNGTLPWRSEEIYRKLVEAFTQQAPYARENIKLFASVMSHYAGDAHVPFHAALNYDGQLTGQWGIHSRFESELFERYQSTLRLSPRLPASIGNPREFIFETLTTGFPMVQPILDADKAAVQGREFYDDAYFEQFFGKVKPILETRLSDSIGDVAGMIIGAWIEAGRPALAYRPAECAQKSPATVTPRVPELGPAYAWHSTCTDEPCRSCRAAGGLVMLWTVVVLLLILWLLGFTMNLAGGLIHILLVIALVVVVFRLLSGRRVV